MQDQAETIPTQTDTIPTLGTRLRAAREAAGKSVADISADTKIPVRMIGIIERDAVSELPVGPYAVNFARTYAKAVGVDPVSAQADMRAMLSEQQLGVVAPTTWYEPAQEDRVPSRSIAWIAAGVAGLLVLAYLVWRSFALTPDVPATAGAPAATKTASAPVASVPVAPAAPAVTIAADAPLRIAASDTAWFSLEDASGRSQFDLTLNGGEYYTVKPGQRALLLRTAKPQLLRLVVGERTLPPLGAPDTLVRGIALDAASLSRLASAEAAPTGAMVPGVAAPASAATGTVAVPRAPQPR